MYYQHNNFIKLYVFHENKLEEFTRRFMGSNVFHSFLSSSKNFWIFFFLVSILSVTDSYYNTRKGNGVTMELARMRTKYPAQPPTPGTTTHSGFVCHDITWCCFIQNLLPQFTMRPGDFRLANRWNVHDRVLATVLCIPAWNDRDVIYVIYVSWGRCIIYGWKEFFCFYRSKYRDDLQYEKVDPGG